MKTEIKEYKQLSHVELKDGRILTSESTPDQILRGLYEKSHIMIEGEVHSKFSVISVVPARLDNVEGLILSQSKEMQQQIRAKIRERKEELGLDTDIGYIQNFIKKRTN